MVLDAKRALLNPKIKTVRQLEDEFGQSARRPRKLVQCHGVFDLLHIGHIRHLQEARQLGDHLVVTITPDRFVNKGPHRPAFAEGMRAEALAALECVDTVCINEWRTAVEVIAILRPDVFLKGAVRGSGPRDRSSAIDHEQAAVAAVGGKVVLTDTELHSASALINRHTDVFSPALKTFLTGFRSRHSAEELIESIGSWRNLRVLVVGESRTVLGGPVPRTEQPTEGPRPGCDHSTGERYASGALAVANVLSSFCDTVALLTFSEADTGSLGFLEKNAADGVELEVLAWNDTRSEELERSLERLLDRSDVVLLSEHGSGLVSPRALSMMRERATYFAVDRQAEQVESNRVTTVFEADLVIQSESSARVACRPEVDLQSGKPDEPLTRLATHLADTTRSKQVMLLRDDAAAVLYQALPKMVAQAPCLPVNDVNRVDSLGTRDALFAMAALCSAGGLSLEAIGFLGNVAYAAASTSAGSGHRLDAPSIFRHIDSLLK